MVLPVLIFLWAGIIFFRHPMLFKHYIWEKLTGKRIEFIDGDVALAIKQQQELDQARSLLPAFKFKNIYQLKAVISWCKENKVGHDQIEGLSSHFEYDGYRVTLEEKPQNIKKIFISLILIVCYMMLIISAAATLKCAIDRSVLAFTKETHNIIFISIEKVEIVSLFGNFKKSSITKDTKCDTKISNIGINQNEYTSICKWLSSGDVNRYIDEDYSINLVAILTLTLSCFYIFYVLIKSLAIYVKLNRLQEYVGNINNESMIQLPLFDR